MRLQTVLNRMNLRDLEGMKAVAEERGMPFHCYRGIHRGMRESDNAHLRIGPSECLRSLDAVGDRRALRNGSLWEGGYKYCTAGLCACDIDPYGCMFLCNQVTRRKGSLPEPGFDACWDCMPEARRGWVPTPC